MMHGRGKSDNCVVPEKSSNNAGRPAAEGREGRRLAKGNSREQHMLRTQGRERMQQALARVRQAATKDTSLRFTALLHHIYSTDTLREAYFGLKRKAAPGVDGVMWRHYGEHLEDNLHDLSERLKRGAYRAKPTRRTFIAKPDGRERPLGVTSLEDKVVQRATVEVLNAIYEVDFLGFSYGFRPGRSQHHALDALYAGLLTTKVNWVLDADIAGFFDAIDRTWLVKFIEHQPCDPFTDRIGDRRVVRLIQKWLNAGVLDEGKRIVSDKGTVQGSSISPLLANVYLHYVFDLWVQERRTQWAYGDVIVVRFADDAVLGFQHRGVAQRFLEDLRTRLAEVGLELHRDKTRLLEFGPYAAKNRREAGLSKPETFSFLGFTHICGKKRSNGMFTVVRQTMRKRLQAKLKDVKDTLRRRLHDPVPEVGQWLASVVRGHCQYYGVPMNGPALALFRYRVTWLCPSRASGSNEWRSLRRRSQKTKVTWERMKRLIDHWIPPARICHPYPLRRLGVVT